MQITISGQHDFPALPEDAALVVALDPGTFGRDLSPLAQASAELRLAMNDLSFPLDDYVHPQRWQVSQLLSFLARHQPQRLHVACYAGISRSAALAAASLAWASPEMSDDAVIAHIREVRPGCFPNPLILAHADHLLGRGLQAACERLLGSDDWTPTEDDYEP